MLSPFSFYNENIDKYDKQLKDLGNKLLLVSILRLSSFLAACWFIYRVVLHSTPATIIAATIFIIIFVISLRLSLNLQDIKRLKEKLLYINHNEVAIRNGTTNRFDNGSVYLNPLNYSGDLDIFGSGSLFELLNRTTTKHGSDKLGLALQQSSPTSAGIIQMQDAIRQLSGQPGIQQELIAQGLLNTEKEGTLNDITLWLQEPNRMLHRKWLQVARFLIPLYNIGAFYYYLDSDNTGPLLIGFLIAWIIIGIFSKYTLSQHKLITKKQAILDQYASILKAFSAAETGSSEVLEGTKQLAGNADKGIHQLARLSGLFDQRLNLIVFAVLNGFLLYDIQCMLGLEKWKSAHKLQFDSWIETVAKIELLNSLAIFSFNNYGYVYPLVHDRMEIEAVKLSHPLIRADLNVANDLKFGDNEKLIILTGSNMSGKTTFLRTLGVNLVLAQCGAPVNAQRFVFKPMCILSSIRVGDSLQENTSYFMAELKKLRAIIEVLDTGIPAIVLIDEILRGTNSDDKTHGSEMFIRKLVKFNCLTLFATHDLSLSVLEQVLDGQAKNYCFESVIEDGQLLFDYKLQRGVARNKNASFLMTKMGII